jgi:integrase
MERPISAKTRKGNRIYRHPFRRNGQVAYSDNYTYRVKRLGKSYYFNIGADKKKAASLADEIATFLAIKTHTIDDAIARFAPDKLEPVKGPETCLKTVGDLIARYHSVTPHLSPATVRDNSAALRRIAAFVLGLPANTKKMTKTGLDQWRKKVDAVELMEITTHQLERFRSSMLAAAKDDNVKRGRAITTSNFYIRAAGSIFSTKLLKHYPDFVIPASNPFRETGQLAEPPHRYVSKIDPAALIEKAEDELRKDYPGSHLAFVLSLYCGMRRAEIDRLTWEQIDLEGGHIWIRTTEVFRPKAKNSESRIDAPASVLQLLREFRPHSLTPPYVLPGTSPLYPPRCSRIFRHLLAWLRANGVEHVQALHALRKEAGSLMYSQTGSIDQAAEFLRNDPRVAREHYIGRKGRLELKIPSAIRVL